MEFIKIILIIYFIALAISTALPDASLFRTIITIPFRIIFSAFRLIVGVASFGKVRIPAGQRRISSSWKARIDKFNSSRRAAYVEELPSVEANIASWQTGVEIEEENNSKPVLPFVGQEKEGDDDSYYR